MPVILYSMLVAGTAVVVKPMHCVTIPSAILVQLIDIAPATGVESVVSVKRVQFVTLTAGGSEGMNCLRPVRLRLARGRVFPLYLAMLSISASKRALSS